MYPMYGPPYSSIPMQSVPPLRGDVIHPYAPYPFSTSFNVGHLEGAQRGGGIISSLFGGSSSIGPAISQSGMSFSTILTNTQRVLGLTQQVVPMIQQYGPLLKNAPAIWKIMRQSNQSDALSTLTHAVSNNHYEQQEGTDPLPFNQLQNEEIDTSQTDILENTSPERKKQSPIPGLTLFI